jgi:hypothetical protein
MNKTLQIALVRLFFAGALFFGSEIILWITLFQHTPLDWGVRLFAYPLIAVILLDLAVRFRIRDEYDSMALMGIYALFMGLLVSPTLIFSDMPTSFVTRGIAGYGLTGLEMFAVLLFFTQNSNRRMKRLWLPAIVWNGFFWGTWARWLPNYTTAVPSVSFEQAIAIVFGGFVVLLIAWRLINPITQHITPQDFRLNTPQWLFVVLGIMSLFVVQALQRSLDGVGVLACILLIVVSLAILWFRQDDKKPMLLDNHFPAQPISWVWIVAGVGLFLLIAFFAYHLPLLPTPPFHQFWLMEVGFWLLGLGWYPLITAVIAFRGFDTQMRRGILQ